MQYARHATSYARHATRYATRHAMRYARHATRHAMRYARHATSYAIGYARVGTWETCNVPRHAHNALPTFEPGRAPRVITASTCHASPTVLPTMKAQSSVVTRSHSSHPRSIWLRYSVRISYDRLFAHRRRFSRTYHRGIPASLCAKHKVLFKGRSEMDIVICHRASLLV